MLRTLSGGSGDSLGAVHVGVALDDTTRDGEAGTDAGKEGVDFAGALATLVDTPGRC